jgi:AraC-like DNA-binding protein
MEEVAYYNSGARSGYIELAKAMSIEKNTIVFPPSFVTGRVAFYELSEELSMTILDCVFHKEIKFRHSIVAGSDSHKILFTVGDEPLYLINEKGKVTMLGDTLAASVFFFTSYTTSTTLHIKAGQTVKAILLHVRQNWMISHLLHPALPIQANWVKELINGRLSQFAVDLDMRSHELIDDIFAAKGPVRILSRQLEGCICQLMAVLCNNLATEEVSEKHIVSDDAMRVLQLKNQLVQNPEEPLMELKEAAARCMMSRTKFVGLFKTLFGKNYGHFFLDLKMERAKELLAQDLSVMDVGYKIGYTNVSPFIKAFRLQYGITPRAYQSSLKSPGTAE